MKSSLSNVIFLLLFAGVACVNEAEGEIRVPTTSKVDGDNMSFDSIVPCCVLWLVFYQCSHKHVNGARGQNWGTRSGPHIFSSSSSAPESGPLPPRLVLDNVAKIHVPVARSVELARIGCSR